jgi:hypothetical protein
VGEGTLSTHGRWLAQQLSHDAVCWARNLITWRPGWTGRCDPLKVWPRMRMDPLGAAVCVPAS